MVDVPDNCDSFTVDLVTIAVVLFLQVRLQKAEDELASMKDRASTRYTPSCAF